MKARKYYLWVDTETASLLFDSNGNPLPADLMEISAILTDDSLHELCKHNWVVKYSEHMRASMPTEVYNIHKDNGLIYQSKHSWTTIEDINQELMDLVNKYAVNNSEILLAGNNVMYDREVIRRNFPDVFSKLYFRVLDISSIKEIMLMTDPKIVYRAQNDKQYKHRALKDIQESIVEFKDYYMTIIDVVSSYS